MIISLSKENLSKIGVFLLILVTFIVPLSKKGESNIVLYELLSLVLSFCALLIFILSNKIKKSKLILFFILLVYFCISTWITVINGFTFSPTRFGYILLTTSILILFPKITQLKIAFFEKILHCIFIVILIGNFISYFNIFGFNTFLVNNYTQYMANITNYHLSIHKPIFIFGVHNLAAFFYTGLFIVSYITYYYGKKRIYLYESIIYFILNVLTRCSTGFAFMVFSCLVVLYLNLKKKKFIYIFIILILISIIFFNSDLMNSYLDILSSNTNGFFSRYLGGFYNLYRNNIDILFQFPMGIGFSIADSSTELFYADSGFLIVLTTGGIIYFILFYYLLYIFLKSNICNKKIINILLGWIMIMELGFVTFYYLKTTCFILFCVIYLGIFFLNLRGIKNEQ